VLSFVSPLRLKTAGRVASRISAPALVGALARRANALSILYGSGRSAVDEEAVSAVAERLTVDDSGLRLVHVRRYSSRQRARMEWPGLVGPLVLRGRRLPELWPLVQFGEQAQVGKGTALGFGRYLVCGP